MKNWLFGLIITAICILGIATSCTPDNNSAPQNGTETDTIAGTKWQSYSLDGSRLIENTLDAGQLMTLTFQTQTVTYSQRTINKYIGTDKETVSYGDVITISGTYTYDKPAIIINLSAGTETVTVSGTVNGDEMSVFFQGMGTVVLKKQGENSEAGKTPFSVSGFAQKGQLIKGASVTAFGLDKDLIATGASYPTSITDDLGSFSLSATGDADYLEFRAEGYYFNENTGSVSEAPIYLQALAEKSETGVNINLLTTLTTARIKHLVKDGKSFADAKKQAQEELLTSLNVNKDIAKVGFETMNIAKGSEADAALLAVSILLQNGRSTGDLLAFIAEMSSEFESTGKLSEKTTSSIFSNTENLSVDAIFDNLVSYYESKGITDYVIPPFYTFVDERYAQDIVLFRNEPAPPSEYLEGTEKVLGYSVIIQ